MNDHDVCCTCWMCEDEREFKGQETMNAKEAREKEERYTGPRCTCRDPYLTRHETSCPFTKSTSGN